MELINQIVLALAVLSVAVETRMLYHKEEIAAVAQKMQHCQTTCVNKFHLDLRPMTNDILEDPTQACIDANNMCTMCYDFCELLGLQEMTYKEEKAIMSQMCTDKLCMDGCLHACAYFDVLTQTEVSLTTTRTTTNSIEKL